MSKRNRQKRKQAKLQRRKRRQKRVAMPSSSATSQDPVYDLMTEIAAEETFSDLEPVINPPGQAKMSEVLEQFIEPYTDRVEDIAAMQKLVTVAVIAWNAAIMADDKRDSFLDTMLKTMPEEIREDVAHVIAVMIRRKNRFFGDNRRPIVNAHVSDLGDSYHLTVASILPNEES